MPDKDYKLNDRFVGAIRKLTEPEFNELEGNILEHGILDNPKRWNGFVLDGHNRIAIAERHGLPFEFTDLDFADEDAALDWIYTNQLGRRSLSDSERTMITGELYELRKKVREANLSLSGNAAVVAGKTSDDEVLDVIGEADNEPAGSTAEAVAQEIGVSPRTVKRAAKVVQALKELPKTDQEAFKKGDLSQKDVLEKAKAVNAKPAAANPEPAKYDDGKNAETVIIENQAKRLSLAIQRFKSKIEEIMHTEMDAKESVPVPLRSIQAQITEVLKPIQLNLDQLNDVFICSACLGTGCDEVGCIGGFVDEDTHLYQVRKIKDNGDWKGKKSKAVRPATSPVAEKASTGSSEPATSTAVESSSPVSSETEQTPQATTNGGTDAQAQADAAADLVNAFEDVIPEQVVELDPDANVPFTQDEVVRDDSEALPREETAAEADEVSPGMEEALNRHPVPPGYDDEPEINNDDDLEAFVDQVLGESTAASD
jgi:hypothetical protein